MPAALAVFVAVLVVVVASDEPNALDARTASFVVEHREPWLTAVLELVTWLGSLAVLVPLLLLAGLVLWRVRGSLAPLLILAATVAGATLLSNAINSRSPATGRRTRWSMPRATPSRPATRRRPRPAGWRSRSSSPGRRPADDGGSRS